MAFANSADLDQTIRAVWSESSCLHPKSMDPLDSRERTTKTTISILHIPI